MAKPNTNKQLLAKNFAFGSFAVAEGGKISVSFDFSKAPVPQDTYSASHVILQSGPGHDCFLVFVQIDPNDNSVRTNLQVRFDDVAMLNAWANSRDFYQKLTGWYEETYGKVPAFEQVVLSRGLPAVQVSANLIFLGHQESSAVAAFYYFDPRAAREIALGRVPEKNLIGTPVVQVKLNTLVVWSLLKQMERYVMELLKNYPSLKARLPTDDRLKGMGSSV